nr:zinc finger BED domain-containing protein DAYSLEEPER-like [Ipomoea batatas]
MAEESWSLMVKPWDPPRLQGGVSHRVLRRRHGVPLPVVRCQNPHGQQARVTPRTRLGLRVRGLRADPVAGLLQMLPRQTKKTENGLVGSSPPWPVPMTKKTPLMFCKGPSAAKAICEAAKAICEQRLSERRADGDSDQLRGRRRPLRPALSRSVTATSDHRPALPSATGDQPSPPRLRPATSPLRASASATATTTTDQPAVFCFWNLDLCSKMTSPSPSVNYSSSAPTGINAEFDFDSEMPSSRQPEPQSPSIEEIEQPNSEEPKPKRAKSTTSDVWKSFTKIGVVDGKEKASVILAIAVVLDPRLKFDMIQYCYKKFDPIGWETKLDVEYTDYSSENVSVIKKSDLDTYLEEGKLDTKSNMHLDVLQYWKEHQARFPCLSKMACDLLSIPITTVASEGSFSIGSRVLTKYRCSLLSENVQALICTRNWLQGYSCEDEDDEGVDE